jgi:hypothetical protein
MATECQGTSMPDELSIDEVSAARGNTSHIQSFRPTAQVTANFCRRHVTPYAVATRSISVLMRMTSTTGDAGLEKSRLNDET